LKKKEPGYINITEQEVKVAVRAYMVGFGYEYLPTTRNYAPYTDDIFMRRNQNKELDLKTITILEYKGGDWRNVLRGIGQLINYSTVYGINKCFLAMPEPSYSEIKFTLDRIPWLGLLVVSKIVEADEVQYSVACPIKFSDDPIDSSKIIQITPARLHDEINESIND
jgi:hypothetical protein